MSGMEPCGSPDAATAAWIAPRLAGEFGAVTRTVPTGYPAYARICHPARDGDGAPTAWSTVAQVTGRWAHPLMQWHALVGSPDLVKVRASLWPGDNPSRGHLAPAVLGPLCDLLARHTTTPRDCFFCLWEGWGGSGDSWLPVAAHSPHYPSHMQTPAESGRARVHHPGRDYLLLAGPLDAALQIGARPRPGWFYPQSPNLLWPADRAWCVATEIDFDSTLVGGTVELVRAILRAPVLDSWLVAPGDSLASNADLINSVL